MRISIFIYFFFFRFCHRSPTLVNNANKGPRMRYKMKWKRKGRLIPFSAFWLRSSVVSVLISLISDTWFIEPHDIKCIFFRGSAHSSAACCWGSPASLVHCTTAHARRTPILQNPKERFQFNTNADLA